MQFQRLYRSEWTIYFKRIKGINELLDKDFIASESFAPIVAITKHTIDDFFTLKDSSKVLKSIRELAGMYLEKRIINRTNANLSEKNYFMSQNSIDKILSQYSLIHTFVFSLLFNKIDPFVNSEKKGIVNPVQRINELWEFTIEYVKGLYELAKNIVEHSSRGRGMITIRAYDYQESIASNGVEKVLETYVFDYGNIGIIPKLIRFTEDNKEKNILFEEDLAVLKDSYSIKDFIKPTSEKLLNQQMYREIAHYGLLRFNHLIEKNEGNVICSSIGTDGQRDIYQYNEIEKDKFIILGTSYFFQLPFKPNLFKIADNNLTLSSEMHGTHQTISGLARILNFILVDEFSYESLIIENSEEIIFDYKFEENIKDRNDEVSAYLRICDILKGKNIDYLSLNMKELKLSSASLLRLSAMISNNLDKQIIVYNINQELYQSMIEDYQHLFEIIRLLKKDVPFWNEDKGILFFSKISNPDFNFADILYGKSIEEFETINHTVSHTFPNLLSLIKIDLNRIENYEIPPCLNSFFNQSSLLPFDVILKNNKDKTLFQSNLELLLSQELRISNN
jgi:hypothetical protein